MPKLPSAADACSMRSPLAAFEPSFQSMLATTEGPSPVIRDPKCASFGWQCMSNIDSELP
jgi:hypothetical protein